MERGRWRDHGRMMSMEQIVSKSSFQAKVLEYLQAVESSGRELVITDHGKPVLKIVPYDRDPLEALKALRGSVLRYDDPLEPVEVSPSASGLDPGDWLEPDDRSALHRTLLASQEDLEAGRLIDAEEVLKDLRGE